MQQNKTSAVDAQHQTSLPLWQRFVFTAIIPTILFYAAIIAVPNKERYVDFQAPQLAVILAIAGVFGFLLFVAAPLTTLSISISFRPWRHWYTSLGAGIGIVLIFTALLATTIWAICWRS